MSAAPLPLPAGVLARVFVRSLFLQAAWNPQGMQNLGFAWAIEPALRALYPDPKIRARAVLRHLELFNCHPYLAAAILGAAVHVEGQVAAGAEAKEKVSQLKKALGPPCAALGDGFYWLALRPAAALVSALTVPTLGLWSLAVFLGLYNLLHLGGRLWLFSEGVRHGAGVIATLAQAKVPHATGLLKAAAAVMAGVLAARAALEAALPSRPGHGLLVAGLTVAFVWLVPKIPFATALYAALLLGLAIGGGFL